MRSLSESVTGLSNLWRQGQVKISAPDAWTQGQKCLPIPPLPVVTLYPDGSGTHDHKTLREGVKRGSQNFCDREGIRNFYNGS